MNLALRIILILTVIIITELYTYRFLKFNFFRNSEKLRFLKIFCIVFPVAFLLTETIINLVIGYPEDDFIKHRSLFITLDLFIFIYLPRFITAFFLIFYDAYSLFKKIILRRKITTVRILPYRLALVIWCFSLLFVIHGYVFQKKSIKLKELTLSFENLPPSFDGFKVIQISDLHLGTFKNSNYLKDVVDKINNINPDLLFITGDIINVSYTELVQFKEIFAELRSDIKIYSILGNHDIGDYFSFKLPENQEYLTQKLIKTQREMGFNLLIDTNVYITKGRDSIVILGVNNCGDYPFKHRGDLQKALKNVPDNTFKVLLSHDPKHWEREVKEKTNISLTLSGHTHAMQMAIIFGESGLSPSALIYNNWYGLYNNNGQYLYVNPGLGYSGFSGRIGTRPEITIFNLKSKK